MTSAEIQEWIAEMRSTGRADGIADCAEKLGVGRTTFFRYSQVGVPERNSLTTRLACAALLAGIAPYQQPHTREVS